MNDHQEPVDLLIPRAKTFNSSAGRHVFFVHNSSIFDIPEENIAPINFEDIFQGEALNADDFSVETALNTSPQSISLNVSSSCNLACSYCYASRGNFDGAQKKLMSAEVAYAAIDRLLETANPAAPITVGFMGGEPFVNRKLIRQCVNYSALEASKRSLDIRFSVTTNGTLLEECDLELIRNNRFAITVSVDGGSALQEKMRPGASLGFDTSLVSIKARLKPLLANPGLAKIAARATVTRNNLDLSQIAEDILELGFTEFGLSPLRNSKSPDGLSNVDWLTYLNGLKEISRKELSRALIGKSIRLTNFAVALKQIHRGFRSPYPCGAGGGYFSIASNGDWYTCHRAIGDEKFKVGDSRGPQSGPRERFLVDKHVNAQTDCTSCWAKYLCSGGCHQEVAQRTIASCDFVRDWLEFCLSSYIELIDAKPVFFRSLSQ